MKFNEDSRVKIPTILHLMRHGYQYLSLKGQSWDLDTNIFPDLFCKAALKINPELQLDDANRLLDEVKLKLCQWPLILTHLWPIKLTHPCSFNPQFFASVDSFHLPA